MALDRMALWTASIWRPDATFHRLRPPHIVAIYAFRG